MEHAWQEGEEGRQRSGFSQKALEGTFHLSFRGICIVSRASEVWASPPHPSWSSAKGAQGGGQVVTPHFWPWVQAVGLPPEKEGLQVPATARGPVPQGRKGALGT